MYCKNCGNKLNNEATFCKNCGKKIDKVDISIKESEIIEENTNKNVRVKKDKTSSANVEINEISKKNIKKISLISLLLFVIVIICITFFVIPKNKVYISNNSYEVKEVSKTNTDSVKTSQGRTSIVYDNKYSNENIENEEDVKKIIEEDAKKQRKNTNKQIREIEENIQKKYGIIAVNFGELDLEIVKEIEKVIDTIYNEFPTIKGDLTNISLMNGSLKENPIAFFNYSFVFATSKTNTTYPWGLKNQIVFNTKYFMNLPRLENTIEDASNSGYFPKNASRSTPVAHEFGHYMSYVATMKNYTKNNMIMVDSMNEKDYLNIFNDFKKGEFSKKMIEEALNNYNKHTGKMVEEIDFRKNISLYAVAKDSEGKYIYDETIAEAFHDYYINRENAKEESKQIMNVLKKYL